MSSRNALRALWKNGNLPDARGRIRRGLVFTFRAALIVFLLAHVYALALIALAPPYTLNMAIRDIQGLDTRQHWVRLEDMSPFLVSAVIAAEDSTFCAHEGIDPEAIEKALEEVRTGERERLRGGSTITQQTAKNVFLWNGGGFARKGVEAWFAAFIDFAWGKRRVMEVCLNVAEWGDGLFGAEAAAQARFGKSASDLSRREAALLAAVLPNPKTWRVDPPGPYVSRRASTLQARMNVVEGERLDTCVRS